MTQPGGPPGLAGEHDELGTIPRDEPGHGPADHNNVPQLTGSGPVGAADTLTMPQLPWRRTTNPQTTYENSDDLSSYVLGKLRVRGPRR